MLRADLPKGLQGAQIIHAAGESSPGNLSPGTHAVCLTVPNEVSLLELEAKLRAARVECVSIVESDAPYTGQIMAIGFAPAGKEVLKRYLSSLPLFR